jgi:hypothetical protein
MIRRLLNWYAARRAPDFVIGDNYLLRWYIKRTGGLDPREDDRDWNLFLHNIRASDSDLAVHDHPWLNVSILLAGSYLEVVPDFSQATTPYQSLAQIPTKTIRRTAPAIIFRRAHHAHRLVIDRGDCWTLFLTGVKSREWGFHCLHGWVHWPDFVDKSDSGKVGRGCGHG